ncbi:MAG: anion permease [Phycisphaerales bacterium]|nr:anion permease [Phycisphaerales bacterium]MCB9835945.1 anion permease [Phycisphaera sp.]
MTWQAWTTLGVILAMVLVLVRGRYGPDVVIVAAVSLLVFLGVLRPDEALAGMSNQGVVTIAVLYVVVCGLTETGAVRWIGSIMLGRPKTQRGALLRLVAPVTALSGFVNNTPIVAMMIPAIDDFCKRRQWPVSKFMIPLSYAAILGGTCTLIGTSTNLVVNGEWVASGREPMGIFAIALVGVPFALVGAVYLTTIGSALLPSRGGILSPGDDARAYTVEMLVATGGPLEGKTIEQAGLRHLPGLFLAEIEREGSILAAVGPNERLQGSDRLVFVGQVDSVVDLQKIRGLEPATNQVVKLNEPRPNRVLVEAVVSNSHPLLGQSVREGRFRTKYNAVIIAVARNGEQIRRKIGEIVIRQGDTLLLEAPRSFIAQMRDSRDYYLVSEVADSAPVRHEKAMLAIGIVGLMVALATIQPTLPIPMVAGGGNVKIGMLHAAVFAAGLMLVLRCCYGWQARKSVDWAVLVTIAGSLALGKALEASGAAERIADTVVGFAGTNPWLILGAVYLMTMLLTEMITNNAAAILMFFIAESAAEKLGVDFQPFAIAIMMAASASFSTPLGYQTNLMVLAPGGYKFGDYLRVGVPLNILGMIVTVGLTPLFFEF